MNLFPQLRHLPPQQFRQPQHHPARFVLRHPRAFRAQAGVDALQHFVFGRHLDVGQDAGVFGEVGGQVFAGFVALAHLGHGRAQALAAAVGVERGEGGRDFNLVFFGHGQRQWQRAMDVPRVCQP